MDTFHEGRTLGIPLLVPDSLGLESETPERKKKISAATLPLAATKTALKAATNSSLTTLNEVGR